MRIRWRRLLTNPATRVESREAGITRLRVDGLVCDTVCAVRTREALAALPGVRKVSVDYDAGVATIEGDELPPEAYDRAVARVVAGRGVRRVIEHVADALRIRRQDDNHPGSPPPVPADGDRA